MPIPIATPHDPEPVIAPEGTCLLVYRGSQAHGMYIPPEDANSIDDIDLMGIVLAPRESYLGLSEWARRGTLEEKRGKWDCVYYEIRKMFGLLLKGNPNVLSILWTRTEDQLYANWAGRLILENRKLFVGKHVYDAFAEYARQQLEKMETRDPAELREYLAVTAELKQRGIHPNHKGQRIPYPEDYDVQHGEAAAAKDTSDEKLIARMRHFHKKGENIGYLGDKRKRLVLQTGYDSKNAAHCIRLLRMCEEFLKTGELTVHRPDAAELLEIKRGQWTLERVKQHARELFERIRVARDASALPAGPDFHRAEQLLVGLLMQHLSNLQPIP